MLVHLETSTLILCYAIFFGFLAAWITFVYRSRFFTASCKDYTQSRWPLLPSLVLGPSAIIFFHWAFGWNLIFPVHMLVSFLDILVAGVIPGLILGISSGLMTSSSVHTSMELQNWNRKPLVRVIKGYGLSYFKSLFPIVIGQAFLSALSASLVWLFAELVVLEALFNAPGLGTSIWTSAKTRDWESLLSSCALLAGLFLVIRTLLLLLNQWLGKKLESYV